MSFIIKINSNKSLEAASLKTRQKITQTKQKKVSKWK